MSHITLLNERSDPSLLVHDFDDDIFATEGFRRYVLEASDRDFRLVRERSPSTRTRSSMTGATSPGTPKSD